MSVTVKGAEVPTLEYQLRKLQEALRDLGFAFAKAAGLIWLIQRTPFLRLKQWVQDREDGIIPPSRDRDA